MIENVPIRFQTPTEIVYPKHNNTIFEQYFMMAYHDDNTEYTYLPIMWTSFYLRRGNGTHDMSDLQDYLDSLDKSKKYFTVLQYDDGILQDINFDLRVFGAGGGGKRKVPAKNIGEPIPLICSPGPVDKTKERDLLCSFVGAVKRRHPIRETLYTMYRDVFFMSEALGYEAFVDVMERSVFSLCPRGYGATSFRICEALQHGSIPIYIYDESWFPDWITFSDIGIAIPQDRIGDIKYIIESVSEEDIELYRKYGEEIYSEYFTFRGCAEQIISMLWIN